MIITCEQCETSYNLDEGLLKPTGSRVRCSKCKHIFRAYPPALDQTDVEAVTDWAPRGPAEELVDSDISTEMEKPEEDELSTGFSLDSEDMGVAAAEAAEEEIDFSDLDKGPEPELADRSEERVLEETGEEELLLDLNSDSDEEERAAIDTVEEKLDLSSIGEELSMVDNQKDPALIESGEEDLHLDLGLGGGEEATAVDETGQEEINLSELEEELSMVDEGEDPALVESGEEDLQLDLDLSGGGEAAAVDETDQEEIDLSELEKELSMVEEGDGSALVESGEEDLQFDFDQDSINKESTGPEPAEDELDLSGLEKELSMVEENSENLSLGLESAANELTQAEAGVEELDLSDIEEMLEEESAEKPGAKDADDLTGLDIEAEEIDLEELEKMLDEEEEDASVAVSEETEELDLDLDIDIEPAPETTSESAAPEEEEMDLGGLEMELDANKTSETLLDSTTDDLELEFITEEPLEEELRMEEDTGVKVSDEADSDVVVTVDDDSFFDSDTEVPEVEIEEKLVEETVRKARKKTPPAPVAKKRTSKLSIILLIVVLIIGSAVILPTLGIQIPFVSDYLKDVQIMDTIGKIPYVGDLLGPKVDEQGNLKMTSYDINSKFIDSTKSGTLFVITGKIRNDYDHSRAFVKVSGRLYATGRKLSKTMTVFCGNLLMDSELSSMDVAAIRKKLLERTGQKHANVMIPPGKDVPFMLVFSDLPPDLEEFDIRVEESMPAS